MEGLVEDGFGLLQISWKGNIGTSVYLTERLDIELNLYIGMIGLENQDDVYNKALQSTSFSLGYTF